MELTLLLSKVFGLFLIIAGTALLIRRHYFVPVFDTWVEQRLTRTVVSLAELLAALFLVMTHNRWSSVPAGIISAIGWMAVVEATAYLLLPDEYVRRLFRAFNKPEWYLFGGLLSLIVGIYLAGFGFSEAARSVR